MLIILFMFKIIVEQRFQMLHVFTFFLENGIKQPCSNISQTFAERLFVNTPHLFLQQLDSVDLYRVRGIREKLNLYF